MAQLIGIDVGTTACKAICVDESGTILSESILEYPLHTPKPGWTEQDPEDWWRAAESCLQQLGEADAIGLTGQMHGSVFLDGQCRVLRNALLWNDQRTAAQVSEIRDRVGMDNLYRITCNPPLTGFQLPKVLWLREHEKELYAQLKSVLLPKDYIRFRMTREMATEPSDASGTGLFDVSKRAWSEEIAAALDLSLELFPRCSESWMPTASYGRIPVVGGGGDQAAGAIGTGTVTSDSMSVSLGTSGVVFSPQDSPEYDRRGRVHTFCHANGAWHSMSVMLSCGGALRWARDRFGFADYDEMAHFAASAVHSEIRFYPYLTGERSPHNDPDLTASLENVRLSDGRAEIARAIFEGITFGLVDGFNILRDLRERHPARIRVTGGGARSDFWLQLLADAMGTQLVRTSADHGPAFGAAILAGVGIGVWPGVVEACALTVRDFDEFDPSPSAEIADRYERWSAGFRGGTRMP